MKNFFVFLCACSLILLSFHGDSEGASPQASRQRMIRIGGGAGTAGMQDASTSSLYQQYGNILNNATGRTGVRAASPRPGGIALGAKINAASLGADPNVQAMLQSGMAAVNAGNIRDISAIMQNKLAAMNSGNVNIPALIQSIALQPRSAPITQNGFSAAAPGQYGPVISAPSGVGGMGTAPFSSPTPSSYAALASQPVSTSVQGSMSPAQYATLTPSSSPIGQYDLTTSQAATLIAYAQALSPSASRANLSFGHFQMSGRILDTNTIIAALQSSSTPQGPLASFSSGSSPFSSAMLSSGNPPAIFGSRSFGGGSTPNSALGNSMLDSGKGTNGNTYPRFLK